MFSTPLKGNSAFNDFMRFWCVKRQQCLHKDWSTIIWTTRLHACFACATLVINYAPERLTHSTNSRLVTPHRFFNAPQSWTCNTSGTGTRILSLPGSETIQQGAVFPHLNTNPGRYVHRMVRNTRVHYNTPQNITVYGIPVSPAPFSEVTFIKQRKSSGVEEDLNPDMVSLYIQEAKQFF